MKKTTDCYNNYIQKGDIINYPIRKGSWMEMRTAKVIEVTKRQLEGQGEEQIIKAIVAIPPFSETTGATTLKRVTISVSDRVTVLPKAYAQNHKKYKMLLDL